MTAGDLFFSTRGRIGRGAWWAGILGVGVASTVGGFIVLGICGCTLYQQLDTGGRLMIFLLTLALFYPAYCVMAKRFQDREESPFLALIGLGLGLAKAVLDLLGVTGDPWHMNGLDYAFLAVQAVVGLWYLVALGCLPGTGSDNRSGPDPALKGFVGAPLAGSPSLASAHH